MSFADWQSVYLFTSVFPLLEILPTAKLSSSRLVYLPLFLFFRLLSIVLFSLSSDLIPSPNLLLPPPLTSRSPVRQESTFLSRTWKLRFFCKTLPHALST